MLNFFSHKHFGNALDSSEDYSSLLLALNQVALVSETDDQGNITYANDKFVEVSKYSREELIGQNHRILKSGDQPDEMFTELWKTISSGQVWRGEIKNKAKDGSYYWVDTSIAPILNQAGRPERYVAVRFLVTDKKQYEENLKEQNKKLKKADKNMSKALKEVEEEKNRYKNQVNETRKFALAVDNTNEHIIITDPEGIVLYANAAAEKTTGFLRKEIIGSKAGKLWGGLMDQDFYKKLWDTIKNQKKTFQGDIKNRRKGGDYYDAYAIISPVLDDQGNILFFIGVERDITKEKEIDRAKSEFVSLASHQLRTPLSAVNWYSEMILDGDAGKLSDKQQQYIKEIYAANQRMVDLVNSLLNVSRIDLGTFSVEPEPVDLKGIAETVIKEEAAHLNTRKIKLDFIAGKFDAIKADKQLARIIFQNLISNAVKYTPPGGHVAVKINTDQAGNFIIEVSDTGYGIPKDQQNRIFTKLFRADNVREKDTDGTGLGLYLVKSILDHVGGQISFSSAENQGTTFTVNLPAAGMQKREGTRRLS